MTGQRVHICVFEGSVDVDRPPLTLINRASCVTGLKQAEGIWRSSKVGWVVVVAARPWVYVVDGRTSNER